MTLPFPFIVSRVPVPVASDALAWWRKGELQYQNTSATLPATLSGEGIRRWDDFINGYSLQNASTNVPLIHSDNESASFTRGGGGVPDFISGEVFAPLLSGNQPFSVITRLTTHSSLALTYAWFTLKLQGSPAASFASHVLRLNNASAWSVARRGDSLVNKTYPGGSVGGVVASVSTTYTHTHIFDGTVGNDYIAGSQIYTDVDISGSATFDRVIMGASDLLNSSGSSGFEGIIHHIVVFDHAINPATQSYWEAQVAA